MTGLGIILAIIWNRMDQGATGGFHLFISVLFLFAAIACGILGALP